MKRPLLLRLAPSAAKPSLFFRFFHRNRDQFSELYRDAELDYSGGARLFDLIPGDVISDQIAFNGFYELALTRRLARMAERGGLFVDVGANVELLFDLVGFLERRFPGGLLRGFAPQRRHAPVEHSAERPGCPDLPDRQSGR